MRILNQRHETPRNNPHCLINNLDSRVPFSESMNNKYNSIQNSSTAFEKLVEITQI